jgi:hypothetical protein
MDLGKSFHDGNKPAALLCLDHTFRSFNTQILKSYSDSQILAMSSALHAYAVLVLGIISFQDPWNKPLLQKLFSFSIRSSGQICLPRGTFLRDCAQRHLRHPSSDDMAVEVRYFYELYLNTLRGRLRTLLDAYCDGCLHVRVFDPCDSFAAGRCDRTECTRQHKLDRTWFDRRLWFHMRLVDLSGLFQFFGGGPRHQRFVFKLSSTQRA